MFLHILQSIKIQQINYILKSMYQYFSSMFQIYIIISIYYDTSII